ncbi:uncharacterized protein LOC128127279 [Lactuca sativa]|uniref:uncharacterized protein LOC128127279 n=1 Tax=Lactuca sativa TaxID=4236 RepID=UPI0022AFE2BC|nr:uncharacterized protein LOC128127279 [Lactuca sativa]
MNNLYHSLEGKGKIYQSGKFSQQQIKDAYEKYVNESSSGRSSSKDSTPFVQTWRPKLKVKKFKNLTERKKENVSDNPKSSKVYVSAPLSHDVELIDSFKSKVQNWVMCEEQYDEKWYIDSGCSRHMTGKKEILRDFRSLDNAGVVKFGNNHKCQVKGYGKVTNGKFTVNRVAYVEGL